MDEISTRTKILNHEILCITETWLNDHIPDEVFQVSGYTIIRKDRANAIRGGRVCTYIREHLPYKRAQTCHIVLSNAFGLQSDLSGFQDVFHEYR